MHTAFRLSALACFVYLAGTPDAAHASAAIPVCASFTDPETYNSYDFCNSPLGLFDTDSIRVKASLGLRLAQWKSATGDSLVRRYIAGNVPDILIGKPDAIYFQLNYTPATITDKSLPIQEITLPLQRFGLMIAGQAPSGIFQIGLRGAGYYGTEKAKGIQNNRLIAGVEDLRLSIGSRLHEIFGVGMQGGATARVDTLRDFSNAVYDRYYSGQVPWLGWYADFGRKGFPVASDFSLQIGTSRFVYVTGANSDRDPIRGDSLGWKWQTIGSIEHAGFVYRPAMIFSYWRNNYQQYEPTPDNDNLDVGPERTGGNWKFSDFCFGIGGSAAILQYASARLEYSHSSMVLAYGDQWPALADRKRGYDRIVAGAEGNIHAIAALRFPSSIETCVRLTYLNIRENSGLNSFQSEDFGLTTLVSTTTQNWRYSPDLAWGQDQRIYGVVFGLGAKFLDRRIQIDADLGLLTKSAVRKEKGLTLAVDLTYELHK